MKNARRGFVFSSFVILLLSLQPALGAEPPAAQTIAKEIRCPVCGMYPSHYPKWMTQVVFTDRTMAAFDSPADLFRFLQNVGKYDTRHTAKDIGAIYFTDYAKGGWTESRTTYFVAGSTAKGPMNTADLPAFGNKEGAESFAKDNGGKVLPFDKITLDLLNEQGAGHDHLHHGH